MTAVTAKNALDTQSTTVLNSSPKPNESKALGQQIQKNALPQNMSNKNLREIVATLQTEVSEKDQLIQQLRNEIETLKSPPPQELFESKIIFQNRDSSSFASFIQIPSETLGNEMVVPEGVVKPTSKDLTTLLENLKPLQKNMEELAHKINTLRDKAETTYEMIQKGRATSNILKDSLATNDPILETLNKEYLTLNPEIEKAIQTLKKTIEKGTHRQIPEEHIQAFSAKNYIPLDKIEENNNAFEKLLKRMQETHDQFSTNLDHIRRRYNDATRHLNDIDYDLGVKENKSGYSNIPLSGLFVSFQTKIRLSPTDPAYKANT